MGNDSNAGTLATITAPESELRPQGEAAFPAPRVAPDDETEAKNFGDQLGSRIFTFWKGRVALFAILKSLGIGAGDRVLIPGYTCFVLPSAIGFAGATPVYADIEPSTFNISVETIEAALRAQDGTKEKLKAIVIQHTFGMPVDTERIVTWARERGIATIEDCAHSLGSGYYDHDGVRHATGSLADAAFFSSHWNKPVSTGIGGWVLANDAKVREGVQEFWNEQCVTPSAAETTMLAAQVGARKILSLPRIYWLVRNTYYWLYRRGLLVGSSSLEELRGEMPSDYAKRMSSFQVRLLKRRLKKNSLIDHRRAMKRVYDEALQAAGFQPFETPAYADPVLLRYPMRVNNKSKILAEAKKRGLEIGDWYSHPIDHPEGVDAESLGYTQGMCPEGERASREVIHFPMGSSVTAKTAIQMVQFVKSLS